MLLRTIVTRLVTALHHPFVVSLGRVLRVFEVHNSMKHSWPKCVFES